MLYGVIISASIRSPMVSAINTSLSGLNAASRRLDVAANNIANISSTRTQTADGAVTNQPYRAQEAVQVSLSAGGVQLLVQPSSAPVEQVYAPDDPAADEAGVVKLPNVNLEDQVVQSKIAGYDYKANLKTIATQDKLSDSLLDLLA